MGKMHQLLAVEDRITDRVKALFAEAQVTFTKRVSELFVGSFKTYKPFKDDDMDKLPDTEKLVQNTVIDKLKYVLDGVVDYIDLRLQKEETNTRARADLIVDGIVIGKNLPVTFLLNLLDQLKKIHALFISAPTLPNGFKWYQDEAQIPGVMTTSTQITYRDRNEPYALELSPATKEHKAQVVEKTRAVKVGKYEETLWDSRVTSQQKMEWLTRIEKLIEAVSKAIRTANDIDADESKIGSKIVSYIFTK